MIGPSSLELRSHPVDLADEPRRNRPWVFVILLSLMFLFSFLDRNILALLAQLVKADLGISNTQFSVLHGVGFGVLYAILGMPIAHWLDRGPRVQIVAAGVAIWSLCTCLTSVATSFPVLLALRMGVAAGEAVLTPAAVSLVADLFPPSRRGAPLAVYGSTGGMMGGMGSFLLGGATYSLASYLQPMIGHAPWRITLFIVGIPGLILAVILLATCREPERRDSASSIQLATVRGAIGYLKLEAAVYLPLFGGLGLCTLVGIGFTAWSPTIMMNRYNYSLADAGLLLGLVGSACGITGALFWPLLGERWIRQGRHSALITALAVLSATETLSVAIACLAKPVWIYVAASGVTMITMGGMIPLIPLTIQNVAPPTMAARVVALYLLIINLMGIAFGPFVIAFLADRVFFGSNSLSLAILSLSIPLTPAIYFLCLWPRQRYQRSAIQRNIDN
jgi:MFS family permease